MQHGTRLKTRDADLKTKDYRPATQTLKPDAVTQYRPSTFRAM